MSSRFAIPHAPTPRRWRERSRGRRRSSAAILAALRVTAGLTFAFAPRRAGSLLVGGDARAPGARLFIRAFGARDVVLGAGTWRALSSSGAARPWLAACVLADAFDTVATLRQFHELPHRRRALTLAASLAPAMAGAAVARRTIVFPHLGHSWSGVGSCVNQVVTAFVDRGTADGLDATGCDGAVVVPPFPLTGRPAR